MHLILRKKVFYLYIVVDAPEESPYDPVGVVGADLGVKNLAVDSDGEIYIGEHIKEIRDRRNRLRSALQSKGTKSAKRHLKKLSGKMARFKKILSIASLRNWS